MAIKAIETKYGGYKFRSRLEARWAVFFDQEEIEWDYEPQGIEVDTPRGRIRYLPDFWLDCGQWVEVKGHLDPEGMRRLHALAVGMTVCGSGNDIAVLGDVPRLRSIKWPVQLHYHRGLWAVPWEPHSVGCPLYRPRVAVEATEEMAEYLTEGFPWGIPDWAEDGLQRARMARFEWGESG
jgi:hypothetical protein